MPFLRDGKPYTFTGIFIFDRTPDVHLHQKVLTLFFLWGVFILATGYSGTLISFMAAPAYHIAINRFKKPHFLSNSRKL